MENDLEKARWFRRVLTDSHFWVPLAVLVGGLLLLRSIR